MDCKQVRELLSDYIDNSISEEDARVIEAHLAQCEDCMQEYRELAHIVRLLSELPKQEIPKTFDASLHETLIAVNRQNPSINVAKPVSRRSRLKRFTSVAAIFIVGLFAITMYNNSDQLISNVIQDSAHKRSAYEISEQDDSYAVLNTEKDTEDTDAKIEGKTAYNDVSGSEKATVNIVSENPLEANKDNESSSVNCNLLSDNIENELDMNGGTETEANGNIDANNESGSSKADVMTATRGNTVTAYDMLLRLYSTDGAIFTGRDPAAVKFYSELLDEELKDIKFEIISCEKNEGIWMFKVETVSTDEDGNEMREGAVYNGQDGTLWKEEVTTTEEAIEELL